MKKEFKVIADLLPNNTRVLDVGCGDGSLMSLLVEEKNIEVRGLEPTEKNAFEYWMGYIKPQKDRRGNVVHANPKWSKINARRGKKQSKRYNKSKDRKSRR